VLRTSRGFSLLELVLVIIIIGVLTAIGVRSLNSSLENRKFLGTKQEMEVIRTAIVGDPTLRESGTRTYFGYVGDVGDTPPNLDALRTAPAGLEAIWDGPYIEIDYQEDADAFKYDAWGNAYTVNFDATDDPPTIVSSSGTPSDASDDFTINIANSRAAIIGNIVEVRIFDAEGVVLTTSEIPAANVTIGYAGAENASSWVSGEQVYKFSSVPIGNREIDIDASSLGVTRTVPVSVDLGDSTRMTVTLDPNYGELQLTSGDGLDPPNQSSTGVIEFSIGNTGTPVFDIIRMTVEWESAADGDCWNGHTPYLGSLDDGTTTFWTWNSGGRTARVGAGSDIVLDNALTIGSNADVTLNLTYADDVSGGSVLNMAGTVFTLTFDPTKGPTQSVTFEMDRSCTAPDLSYGAGPTPAGTPPEQVNLTVSNDGSLNARIKAMTVIGWTGGDANYLTGISIGSTGWSGTRSAGDICYLNNIADLASGNTAFSLTFDDDMTASATGGAVSFVEVKFTYTDNSTQTVVFN